MDISVKQLSDSELIKKFEQIQQEFLERTSLNTSERVLFELYQQVTVETK